MSSVTKIEIELPVETVKAASDAGLLTPRALDRLLTDAIAEMEMLGDMASYRSKSTGVDNVIFVSTKEGVRHGPRIKLAVDPPDSLNGVRASLTIPGGEVVAGPQPKATVLKQAREWIALNREALLDYWEQRISTDELEERMRPVPGR